MRIIAGGWRGKALAAPPGMGTRPTSDRVRQAVFDMVMHASWGGPALIEEARVLDAFAGTGAFGLEALSRGAGHATFIERDRAALAALRANIATCRAEPRSTVLAADVLRTPRGEPVALAFLDPPYDEDAVPNAVAALTAAGWLVAGSVLVAETGRIHPAPDLAAERLAERSHGAARVTVWRL
jgi:16S rRNA (guanine966-N2)-methyltransferase